jgi:hypothetical protein
VRARVLHVGFERIDGKRSRERHAGRGAMGVGRFRVQAEERVRGRDSAMRPSVLRVRLDCEAKHLERIAIASVPRAIQIGVAARNEPPGARPVARSRKERTMPGPAQARVPPGR